MIKTIPVIYRSSVFVPTTAVHEIAEEASLEIAIYLPVEGEEEAVDETGYSLEQNLTLLYQTSGGLKSHLSVDEVRYIVESDQLAELTAQLNVYEEYFGITSDHFLAKYQASAMGDDADVFEWQVLYKMHQRLQGKTEPLD